MKLEKRIPETSIKLTPGGYDTVEVEWKIGNDKHIFGSCSTVSGQFGIFLSAIYGLYEEVNHTKDLRHFSHKYDHHRSGRGKLGFTDHGNLRFVNSDITWNNEGPITEVRFSRHFKKSDGIYPDINKSDPVHITIIDNNDERFYYRIEARELCYAAAKAVTDVIKKCGIYGYINSTGDNELGDCDFINLDQFMFIKAYALGCLEVRDTTIKYKDSNDGWEYCEITNFEDEIELLLFDM